MKPAAWATTIVIATGFLVAADARQPAPAEVLPGRYIVEFDDPPVMAFDGYRRADGDWLLEPTRPKSGRVDAKSDVVTQYLDYLDEQTEQVLSRVSQQLARPLSPRHRYQFLTNGVSLDLAADEALLLSAQPGIRAVYPVTVHRPQTDAGPAFIGAPEAWQDSGSFGEGVVIGIVDSGVNWDHPAFADVGGDGYNHDNPRGRQFGLCSNAQVRCNDKLIGVYEYTQEGARLGRDVDGHGTHVAATAAGNRVVSDLNGNTAAIALEVSGVAPHANIISYKVCLADDINTDEDENVCLLDGILDAFDQAVIDQVDIVNYSIGGNSSNPWGDPDARVMLTARNAGLLVVTSAGNSGSEPDTLTSPANAPWLLSVANISHNRSFISAVEAMAGGNAEPPNDLQGLGLSGDFGPARIVYAGDFGNALCGTGNPELRSRCNAHTGSTNPFAPGTFDGEIVVCDRGTYGRIEKSFNVRAAGAGGYILANTPAQGESTSSDDHCLPGTHLGRQDGDILRAWLAAGGDNLTASIADRGQLLDDSLGDRVAASSSRGPDSFVPDVVKPDLAAPGSNILAAGLEANNLTFKTGTSMASPHVAGAAALLLSVRPELSPAALHSILVSTAFNDAMLDSDGQSLADAYDVGAGRVNPAAALRAGLALDVSTADFLNADPGIGGQPAALNLPALASSRCVQSCQFNRRVQAVESGQWTATVVSRDGVVGSVSPPVINLTAGGEQALDITLDVSAPGLINQLVTGYVVLTPEDSSLAVQRLPFQLRADAGELPTVVTISTSQNRGSDQVQLGGLVALPQAGFDTLGLRPAQLTSRVLAQDNTNADPYNNLAQGAYFITRNVSADQALLFASVTSSAAGTDLDLFVGRDLDGDLQPDENEELCRSTSPGADEACVLDNLQPGQHWVLVQNWRASSDGAVDPTVLTVATVDGQPDASLTATGPGQTLAQAPFQVRLAWDQGTMAAGETWVGALLPRAADAGSPLGVIPVVLERQPNASAGTAGNPDLLAQAPLLLIDGEAATVTLEPNEGHGRAFIDLPASATGLTLTLQAPNSVSWELVAQPAVFAAPDVTPVSTASDGQVVASGSGSSSATFSAEAGRYYVVPVNNASRHESVSITVTMERVPGANLALVGGQTPQGGTAQPGAGPVQGLWFNPDRNGAGFNLNLTDGQLILEWYTYLEDGTPIWYLAQGPYVAGDDFWQAPLNYFSWDGSRAAATTVGHMSLVFETPQQAVVNYVLNGLSGSELYQVIIPDLSCASNGDIVQRTGLWFMPALPGFGYSILSAAGDQVHINYLYGNDGSPRWVLGQSGADSGRVPLAWFSGFCPSCTTVSPQSVAVGENEINYESTQAGTVQTRVEFPAPAAGLWEQSGPVSNLTPTVVCE